MEPQRISVTVEYSKPGTQPPIYLAGSFSNPEWQPQVMQHTLDGQGEYRFTKEVEVEEGKEYQYKFRVGEGNWWLLNEEAPTVTDDIGNRNNLLALPLHKNKVEESEETRAMKDNSHIQVEEPAPVTATPTLVVEQPDSEPRHVDNARGDAPIAPKAVQNLRTQDAEPAYVVVRSDTPELANNAAEVADSAMMLDHETSTPPLSDEEAGRIGYRRMSHTPIPEVAMTAAEVADIAAILDKDHMSKIEMPPKSTFSFDSPQTPDSGSVTPLEDRVPLFAHECIQPPKEGEQYEPPLRAPPEPNKPVSYEEETIDFNDPLLEEFPCERAAILERVRTSQTRLAEDQTSVEGIPPSPVVGDIHRVDGHDVPSLAIVGANHHERLDPPSLAIVGANHHERLDPPSPSSAILAHETSPSLDSIPEEDGDREVLSTLSEGTSPNLDGEPSLDSDDEESPNRKEREPSLDAQEVNPQSPPSNSVEPTQSAEASEERPVDGSYTEPEPIKSPAIPFVFDGSEQVGEQQQQTITTEEGPNIVVQPATPGSSFKNGTDNPFENSIDTATATAIEERSKLTSRKAAVTSPERCITPSSMHSAGKDAKSGNFLRAFWRVVFVEWIGGFFMRLCGGRHKKLLAISALVVVTVAPAVYYSV